MLKQIVKRALRPRFAEHHNGGGTKAKDRLFLAALEKGHRADELERLVQPTRLRPLQMRAVRSCGFSECSLPKRMSGFLSNACQLTVQSPGA